MKKGFIKFFVWLVIFIAIGGTAFFAGWMQFAVPAGNYGVMLSKSGGYHFKPITPGEFSWRWERLIPTNTNILIFNLSPLKVDYSTQGVLPSADKLFKIMETKVDFSWRWGLSVFASVNPSDLIAIVKSSNMKTQGDLDEYIRHRVSEASQKTVNDFISKFLRNPADYEREKFQYALLQDKISEDLQKKLGSGISIKSVQLSKDFFMPDMILYDTMMKAYINYEKQKAEELTALSVNEAKKSALARLRMDDLKQWGELLKEYPVLIDFLAVARNDAGEALKALKDLKSNIVNPALDKTNVN